MTRLSASTNRDDIQDPRLIDVTNWNDREGAFVMPSAHELRSTQKRIIVCTCLMAAKVSGCSSVGQLPTFNQTISKSSPSSRLCLNHSSPPFSVVTADPQLWVAGIPEGFFTHCFVDEAGHAEEPLLMCVLAGHAQRGTRVVIAGESHLPPAF